MCDVVNMESSRTLVARGLTKVFHCQTGKTSLDQSTCHVCRTRIAGRKQVQTTDGGEGRLCEGAEKIQGRGKGDQEACRGRYTRFFRASSKYIEENGSKVNVTGVRWLRRPTLPQTYGRKHDADQDRGTSGSIPTDVRAGRSRASRAVLW